MTKNSWKVGNYAVPLQGRMANLPMKITKHEYGFYILQHPTTGIRYTFKKEKLRAGKRKEIEAIRK